MAYDERLADRVRDILLPLGALREQKMFGGLCFIHRGHMCCGIVADDLMLRLGEHGAAEALGKPHVRPMDFTGRPMSTMVYVAPAGIRGVALRHWVDRAVAFIETLRAKA